MDHSVKVPRALNACCALKGRCPEMCVRRELFVHGAMCRRVCARMQVESSEMAGTIAKFSFQARVLYAFSACVIDLSTNLCRKPPTTMLRGPHPRTPVVPPAGPSDDKADTTVNATATATASASVPAILSSPVQGGGVMGQLQNLGSDQVACLMLIPAVLMGGIVLPVAHSILLAYAVSD